jgi:hypothetical protein
LTNFWFTIPTLGAPAQQHGDLQGLEEPGAAILHVRIRALIGLGRVTLDGDPVIPLVVFEHGDHGKRMRLHAREGAQAFAQATEIIRTELAVITVRGGVDVEGQQIFDIEAGIQRLQVAQTLQEQSGRDQQQQRQRNLRHNEALAQSRGAATDYRARLVLQCVRQFRPRGLQ